MAFASVTFKSLTKGGGKLPRYVWKAIADNVPEDETAEDDEEDEDEDPSPYPIGVMFVNLTDEKCSVLYGVGVAKFTSGQRVADFAERSTTSQRWLLVVEKGVHFGGECSIGRVQKFAAVPVHEQVRVDSGTSFFFCICCRCVYVS